MRDIRTRIITIILYIPVVIGFIMFLTHGIEQLFPEHALFGVLWVAMGLCITFSPLLKRLYAWGEEKGWILPVSGDVNLDTEQIKLIEEQKQTQITVDRKIDLRLEQLESLYKGQLISKEEYKQQQQKILKEQ